MQPLDTEPGLQALCEPVLAAPGSGTSANLPCTSLQHLAMEPVLQALRGHVPAAPGSEARPDLTSISCKAWLRSQGFQICVNNSWPDCNNVQKDLFRQCVLSLKAKQHGESRPQESSPRTARSVEDNLHNSR